MDYNEERSTEIAEAVRVRALYPAIAAAITKHDPTTSWTVKPTIHEYPTNAECTICADDGRAIHTNGISRSRLTWHTFPPTAADGHHMRAMYGMTFPSITTSADRAPESIASDIIRRLLPAYTAAYRELLRQAESDEQYAQQLRDTRAHIVTTTCATTCGPDIHQNPQAIITRDNGHATIYVHSDRRVRIDMTVDVEAAITALNAAFPTS